MNRALRNPPVGIALVLSLGLALFAPSRAIAADELPTLVVLATGGTIAGTAASDDLNPQKARILLRLALLKPRSAVEVQQLFAEY